MTVVKYGHEKLLNRDHESFVVKTFIQENENTPLKFDVIFFQVTVLRCICISLKTISASVVEISHDKYD